MFFDFYKLSEQPFGVTPNPRYLFLTPTHREAIASIVYGVMENRGFSALIAPPGMGKTTLLFDLLKRCGENLRTVFLFQFQPSPEGLLRNLLAELDIPAENDNLVEMQEKLNQAILREANQGHRIVVVVDEAQNFREPVLEVLRMLSNFETSQDKLIHIILSGQPQLAEMLSSPSIEQLRQRISIVAALQPLDAKQTRDYIDHRLRVSGYKSTRPLFSEAACNLIAEHSGGIPRTINNLCFNSLSLGCALKHTTIGSDIISEVIRDLDLDQARTSATTTRTSLPPEQRFIAPPLLLQPPKRSSGGGIRLITGLLAVAALSVAAIFAYPYLNLIDLNLIGSGAGFTALPTPPPPQPPAAQTETSAQIPVAEPASDPAATAEAEAPELPAPSPAVPVASLAPAKAPVTAKKEEISLPPLKNQRVKLVTVPHPETLYRLCLMNMDECDAKTLQVINELNPGLRNLKQLHTGQKVRMPLEGSGDFSPHAQHRKNPHAGKSGENR